MGKGPTVTEGGLGLKSYYRGKIEELEMLIKDKSHNLRRLEAQRNELNTQGIAAQSMQLRHVGSATPCSLQLSLPIPAISTCAAVASPHTIAVSEHYLHVTCSTSVA